MTMRTCDLGQVVGLVNGAASRGSPVMVAVSGFAASGKTTLATRLQERLTGAAVVDADLLAGTAPARMTDTWAAGRRKDLRRRIPDAADVVIVEGRGLLHPEIASIFQVRVWLDLDLEDATMQGTLSAYEESRREGGPVGQWVAEEPPLRVRVDPAEAEFLARFRPDHAADVLFVPVGGMVTPIRLRFMTEIGCDFVLWDEGNEYLGEIERLLPIPADLRERLLHHAGQWYRQDAGEPEPDWPGLEEFDRRGYLLSQRLQQALGPDYRVQYAFDTAEARTWAARRD
jgi:hypothetical protein